MQKLIQDDTLKIDPVVDFMRQTVLSKYGEKVDQNFLEQETNRIYSDFGNNLFSHFKPMIPPEKKIELDKIIDESKDQDVVMAFLMESIENFEQKIIQYLVEYRNTYIAKPANI